ncbi:MAG TPA: hypothetical protein VMW68_03870 [Methyloceanibacter sp.]|nr:hypothetical protein [Methyloceanibacter sp.]
MTKARPISATPRHQVSGDDYPGEWARQVELTLDQEQRRLFFYGGLFGAFVLAIVIAALIGVVIDAPPLGR